MIVSKTILNKKYGKRIDVLIEKEFERTPMVKMTDIRIRKICIIMSTQIVDDLKINWDNKVQTGYIYTFLERKWKKAKRENKEKNNGTRIN